MHGVFTCTSAVPACTHMCRNEHSRGVHHLRHPRVHNGTKVSVRTRVANDVSTHELAHVCKLVFLQRVYSASECEHFFVCTHSQTCDS